MTATVLCLPLHPSRFRLGENKLWRTIGTNGFCTKPHDGCILVPCISSLSLFFSPSLPILFFLSPLSPALYVSVWKLERSWALSHPTTLSLYGYIICLPFLAMTLYSHWQDIKQTPFSCPLSFSSPRCLSPCCLQWFSRLLHYPPEHSANHDCKANAWDFLKLTVSVLCHSPICG